MPDPGQNAPDFRLRDQEENWRAKKDYLGGWLVLYFYPKDNTSGCTLEAKDFTCMLDKFEKLEAQVVGVSPDSASSHQRFIAKQELNLTLLSDPDHELLKAFDAWGLKKFMGREYEGVIRSTFLIDPKGVIRAGWTNVKVKGHVERVLDKLRALKSNHA